MNLPLDAGTLRRDALDIMRHAILGVDPEPLCVRALSALPHQGRVRIVCAGKAAAAMARGAASVLGERIVDGLLISPAAARVPGFESLMATHPLPTLASERAGRAALAVAGSVTKGERLVCLLSGGASALMAVPAEGVTLADKATATQTLMRAGADIRVLNAVRTHLSDIKGGGLARRSATGCHTLAVSDVVDNDVAVIGSGPGVPDRSTFADALAAIHRFGGPRAFPPAVVTRLEQGALGYRAETLKAEESDAQITGTVIGGRLEAMSAARDAALRLGYRVVIVDEPIVGDVRGAAQSYVGMVRPLAGYTSDRMCIVSSGETTVRVTGAGTGGRNQEFALAAALELAAGGPDGLLLSVGTDGVDGPTAAAGACADRSSMTRARSHGLDPLAYLENNDSFSFFESLGDLIVTGPTGTNVGDLQIFLTAPG